MWSLISSDYATFGASPLTRAALSCPFLYWATLDPSGPHWTSVDPIAFIESYGPFDSELLCNQTQGDTQIQGPTTIV